MFKRKIILPVFVLCGAILVSLSLLACSSLKVEQQYPDVRDPSNHPDPTSSRPRESVFGPDGLSATIHMPGSESAAAPQDDETTQAGESVSSKGGSRR